MPNKVYFVKLDEIIKIKDLLPEFPGKLGVKLHFGEDGNTTFVPASYSKKIVSWLNEPILIETGVLYKSPRSLSTTHKEVALKHGFDFAPIDFLDGETGNESLELSFPGKFYDKIYLGKNLEKYRSLLVISHFKGHVSAGFGGAIKNLSMGLASRRGKLALHAAAKHQINADVCIGCGICIDHCPANAISFDENNKARIDQKLCISCSECLSTCPVNAIGIPWGSVSPGEFRERLAEYAKAAVENRVCYYINFLMNITNLCDCRATGLEILTPDIGVLAGSDPVAIDQASYDLVLKQYPDFVKYNCDAGLAYAETLGMGSRQYEIVNL